MKPEGLLLHLGMNTDSVLSSETSFMWIGWVGPPTGLLSTPSRGPGPQLWEAGNQVSEPRHGLLQKKKKKNNNNIFTAVILSYLV
jgi:hypothetical protein